MKFEVDGEGAPLLLLPLPLAPADDETMLLVGPTAELLEAGTVTEETDALDDPVAVPLAVPVDDAEEAEEAGAVMENSLLVPNTELILLMSTATIV